MKIPNTQCLFISSHMLISETKWKTELISYISDCVIKMLKLVMKTKIMECSFR